MHTGGVAALSPSPRALYVIFKRGQTPFFFKLSACGIAKDKTKDLISATAMR
jgi:hypothetical protein